MEAIDVSMAKKKRLRAPNFTNEEIRLLLKLALAEKHVLENKKTDSEAWKLKDETWVRIANSFNSISGLTFRTVNTLRHKYEGTKKDLKKKVNKNKEETMKTGGGIPDFIKIDGPEKELLEVLSISINGLPSQFDSDYTLPQTTITGELPITEHSDEDMVCNEHFAVEALEDGILGAECNVPVVTISNVEQYLGQKEEKRDVEVVGSSSITDDTAAKKEQSWKGWSSSKLKTKRHPALTPRRTTAKDALNQKMEANLEQKTEVHRQQIVYIANEDKRAQAKFEREMECWLLKY